MIDYYKVIAKHNNKVSEKVFIVKECANICRDFLSYYIDNKSIKVKKIKMPKGLISTFPYIAFTHILKDLGIDKTNNKRKK